MRYTGFAHHVVPFGVIVFTDMIYLSSGVLNVLFFSITRPLLLPHDMREADEAFDITQTRFTHSQLANNNDRDWGVDILDQCPRCETPDNHIQSDFVCEATTRQ